MKTLKVIGVQGRTRPGYSSGKEGWLKKGIGLGLADLVSGGSKNREGILKRVIKCIHTRLQAEKAKI